MKNEHYDSEEAYLTAVAAAIQAVEAVVDEGQQIAKQLGERFHGNPL